jgi:hypothetical protein
VTADREESEDRHSELLSSRCLTGLYGVITLNQTLRWAVESASTAIAQPDGQ